MAKNLALETYQDRFYVFSPLKCVRVVKDRMVSPHFVFDNLNLAIKVHFLPLVHTND